MPDLGLSWSLLRRAAGVGKKRLPVQSIEFAGLGGVGGQQGSNQILWREA
jgi:hypothetical protein